jgi:hypothetical protein
MHPVGTRSVGRNVQYVWGETSPIQELCKQAQQLEPDSWWICVTNTRQSTRTNGLILVFVRRVIVLSFKGIIPDQGLGYSFAKCRGKLYTSTNFIILRVYIRKVADSRSDVWVSFISIYPILPAAIGPGVYSASNRNEYHEEKIKVSGE